MEIRKYGNTKIREYGITEIWQAYPSDLPNKLYDFTLDDQFWLKTLPTDSREHS